MKKLLVRCTYQTPEGVCGFTYSADADGANPDMILIHALENSGHVVAVAVTNGAPGA